MTAKKRRNAIDDADYEDAYLVHGDFGEDADDNGYKDTRCVLLSDILNLSARDLEGSGNVREDAEQTSG